jgi:tripartite-type tricarboxylate transporter receptor subunit TctC
MLQRRGAFSMLHVPYTGAAPLVTDLIAGRVDTAFVNAPAAMPHVESGRLRYLAATPRQRIPVLPDVPTLTEAFPGLAFEMWYGMLGPASMPAPIVDRLQRAFRQVIRMPEISERLQRDTFVPVGSSPEEFASQIRADILRFQELVASLGLRAQ